MMLIIFYGRAKRLEKIFSPYGPIYFRKLIQLAQLMAYRYHVLSVASTARTKPSCCLAVFLSRLISPLNYWSCTAVGKIYRIRKTTLSELGPHG